LIPGEASASPIQISLKHFRLPAQFTEEHAKIGSFAATRVFPMVDEFAAAHRLKTSVEASLIALLATRLIYQGMAPTRVMEHIEATMTAFIAAQAAARDRAEPSQEAEIPAPANTNVLPFSPRPRA
jgi:hypothetical protein